MGLALVLELQHVLDAAEEPVGVGQHVGVVGVDVAALAELRERGQRAAHAQLRVHAAVDELQELGGELDVADPARPSLDVAVRAAAPARLRLGPHLEGAHVTELVDPERRAPQHRRSAAVAQARPSVSGRRRPARP